MELNYYTNIMTNKISIAEIGINHGGDHDKLFRMIKLAKDSGCNSVKFQYRSESFFSENQEMGSTLIIDELDKSKLDDNWINSIITYCKEIDVKIGFSFFKKTDLENFNKKFEIKNIDFIKIPSPEFRNIELIRSAKKTKKPVYISYGGGNEEEIYEYIEKAKLNKNDCVFHCITNYPVAVGNQQLGFIEKLSKKTNSQIGYSSHDENWEICLLAISLGANIIERHFCESKNDTGLDISTSSDPSEFKQLNLFINNYNKIIGDGKRLSNQGEIVNVRNLGVGVYYNSDLQKGIAFDENHTVELSPATGIRPNEVINLYGKKLIKKVQKGDPVNISDFKESFKIQKESGLVKFMDSKKLSLPVRLHDFKKIKEKFSGTYYELHLSFKEVAILNKNPSVALDLINQGDNISIHLPDYISKDHLIDPFSDNDEINLSSNKIIDNCIEISKQIKNKSKKECLILGSFSVNNFKNKEIFYHKFKEYTDSIKEKDDVLIAAQWLPRKAWYFGGSALLNLFVNEEDINFVKKNKINICIDLAHLILSANYYEQDWRVWYEKLKENCVHIHISDAAGTDGEGVEFGKGNLSNYKEILDEDYIKVIEVWEGHLNGGEKFHEAIKFLKNIYDE